MAAWNEKEGRNGQIFVSTLFGSLSLYKCKLLTYPYVKRAFGGKQLIEYLRIELWVLLLYFTWSHWGRYFSKLTPYLLKTAFVDWEIWYTRGIEFLRYFYFLLSNWDANNILQALSHFFVLVFFNFLLLSSKVSFFIPWSSISPWWGSKDFKGVSNPIARFKWCYFTLWSPQSIPWWKDTGSNPWFNVAVAVHWNWKGFGHSWKSSWRYAPASNIFMKHFLIFDLK